MMSAVVSLTLTHEAAVSSKLSFPPSFALITMVLISTLEGMQKYILADVSIPKI